MDHPDFRTLNELFLRAVDKNPKPAAFMTKTEGKYRGLSSQEALSKVAALAAGLDRRGVCRGDRVAILSENRVEWALTDYAVLGLGAILVPIYPTLLEPDIEYILQDSNSKGIICSNYSQMKKILNVRARLPELSFILMMDSVTDQAASVENWQSVIESAQKAAPAVEEMFRTRALEVRPEETASILYTSGTMGQPKGVILTHSNLVSNIHASFGLFPFGSDEIGMSFLPLCHVYERMLDYHYFWSGVSIAYAESIEALPQNLLEVRPTVMAVVPRILEKVHARVMDAVRQSSMTKQKLFQWAFNTGKRYFPYALEHRKPPMALRMEYALADRMIASKVRARLGGRIRELISGAAPLSRDLAEFFFAMGLPVYEGYGLTETSPVISVNYPGGTKLGTVGRVIPGVEVKLDAALTNPDGGGGREILVRGPNVTPGYYHLDEENRHAFQEGWLPVIWESSMRKDFSLSRGGRKIYSRLPEANMYRRKNWRTCFRDTRMFHKYWFWEMAGNLPAR